MINPFRKTNSNGCLSFQLGFVRWPTYLDTLPFTLRLVNTWSQVQLLRDRVHARAAADDLLRAAAFEAFRPAHFAQACWALGSLRSAVGRAVPWSGEGDWLRK